MSVIIQNLKNIGFYDVFLPFILVYAVIFAVLEKSKIFSGSDSDSKQVKNINAVIAFVFGLFVVASIQVVKYIQHLIIEISLFVIFILVVLILLAFIFGDDYTKLLKGEDEKMKNAITWTIAGTVLLISVGVLFWVLDLWTMIFDWWNSVFDSGTATSIIVIIFIIGIIVWITKSDGSNSKKSESSNK